MTGAEFNREVTVECKSLASVDPIYGTQLNQWEPLVALPGSPVIGQRFWAKVEDLAPGKSEAVMQGVNLASDLTRITMRYRADIDSSMRIVVHGDADYILQIASPPAMIGRKQYIVMVCTKFSS